MPIYGVYSRNAHTYTDVWFWPVRREIMLQRLKDTWYALRYGLPPPWPEPEPMGDWLIFPCAKCQEPVTVIDSLDPGQVAVTKCENCGASWSVFLPKLEIIPTDKFEPVWEHLKDDPFEDKEIT